jgi:hypothetical protein
MYALSHCGGAGVFGGGASSSVLGPGGAASVSGVAAVISVLAASGGAPVSGVGASPSGLAARRGVGRERDPRPAPLVVGPRELRPGLAVLARCAPAAEALGLRRVVARVRGVAAVFFPLNCSTGEAAGSRRSISSASARSSATAARATRCAFLPALSLTPLSVFAACLRRPTCRRRSNRSASFLAMIFLLLVREIGRSQPCRGAVTERRCQPTRQHADTRCSHALRVPAMEV